MTKLPDTPQSMAQPTPSAPRAVQRLWAVCDPVGHIDHTTLATRDDESIAAWMKTEQTMIKVLRGTPAPSWEVYEAEGYRVVRCDLVPNAGDEPTAPSATEKL